MGLLVVTQEEKKIAIKVWYITEFDEPDESEWPRIITELSKHFGLHLETIKKSFTVCHNGEGVKEKWMKGAGQKLKLVLDDPRLIAGAVALNGSTLPKKATDICNAVNQLKFPEEFEEKYSIC